MLTRVMDAMRLDPWTDGMPCRWCGGEGTAVIMGVPVACCCRPFAGPSPNGPGTLDPDDSVP